MRQVWHQQCVMSANAFGQKRILLVSPYLPLPPESGARQRSYFFWKAVGEIAPVDVILCTDLLDRSAASAALPDSMNFLGRFPWKSPADSLLRLFEKSTLDPRSRSPVARDPSQGLGLCSRSASRRKAFKCSGPQPITSWRSDDISDRL